MFKKLNDFFKKIDEKILKGGEEVKQQTHNFKGERFLFFLISKKNFSKEYSSGLWGKVQDKQKTNFTLRRFF